MALFSIKNERDLVVINSTNDNDTAQLFLTAGLAGEGRIYNEGGILPLGKSKFAVYIKHLDGRMRRSDIIDPDKIVSVKKQIPVAVTLPSTIVTIPTAVIGDLYEIHIKIFNDGSLSNDNCVLLSGYYQATGSNNTTAIALGLANSLRAGQTRMGQSYFTITESTNTVILTSTALPFVVGKKDGRQLRYQVKGLQFDPLDLGQGTVTWVDTAGVINPCSIEYLQDLEWQTRGAYGDTLRGLAYPFDFQLLSDIVPATVYTLIEITYYDGDQDNHAVQPSPRHLTVACSAAALAAFETQLAFVRQPIDLATGATNGQVMKWTDALGDFHPVT